MKLQCSKKLFFLRWMELEIAPLASISPSQKRKKEKRTRDPMIIQHASKPRFNLKKDAIFQQKKTTLEFHCNGLGAGTERTQFHSKFNEYFCCKRLPDVFPRLNPTNEWKVSLICIDFVPKCIHESSCLAFFFRSFIERERERKQLNGNN